MRDITSAKTQIAIASAKTAAGSSHCVSVKENAGVSATAGRWESPSRRAGPKSCSWSSSSAECTWAPRRASGSECVTLCTGHTPGVGCGVQSLHTASTSNMTSPWPRAAANSDSVAFVSAKKGAHASASR